ncbi:MAG TPA: TolC family protein [Ramlibacter sp.]|uniref:TolC family protein n=1 Tax=Ramlibacter sp. TaxID=1917967 RepID=UPI002D4EF529|nr:TolC family protein [Ramlibacter sp.]HZY19740.1 TolC family protein [Ramlibacter sp.]
MISNKKDKQVLVEQEQGSGRGRATLRATVVATALAAALAGCAVTPEPMTTEERSTRAQEDLSAVIEAGEPVTAPLTLADAMARAVRHNLEFKVRQMEAAVQARQLDLSNFDMLPRLALQAGYTSRSNDAFGLGYQPNGTISSVPSSAVERSHSTYNASLSWNVLDFGVSYYRAKQAADSVLVAEERRRRALQNLLLEVQLAWWRAEASQRLLPQIDAMLVDIERAAERSRLIEARRLLPPLQIIAYRRSLLDLQQQLTVRRQELVQWRSEFAELAGLRPGQPYRLASAAVEARVLPNLVTRVDDLEAMALERRPELAEERYRERITAAESRKQMLALLPNLTLSYGTTYDSNRFLINNQWNELGSLVTFNLLRLFSLPATRRSQEAAVQLDQARRLAVSMAVMTQTRVSVNRYQLLKHELGVWNEALEDDRSLLRAMRATQQAGLETELELIRASARLALTEINRDVVHANLEHAMGRVMNSVGYDVVPPDAADATPTLATQMASALAGFNEANYSAQAAAPVESVALGNLTGLPNDARRDFTESMRTVLRVVRVPIAEQGAAIRTDVAVTLGPKQDSGRPVALKVTLLEGSGQKVLHTAEMRSMLVDPVTPEQWKVLGEAAVFRVAETLKSLLSGGLHESPAADTLSLTDGGLLKLDRRWTGPRPVSAARP